MLFRCAVVCAVISAEGWRVVIIHGYVVEVVFRPICCLGFVFRVGYWVL